MADKLSWTELRRALAVRAGVGEKEAGAFLAAFNAQLVEALKSDKQVKINGLGTFRLQAVAPRKSVNISTGEEITIEGYNKLVFAPEAGLKELVEKVKEEGPVEIDPLKKLGAQAEEIVDILGELGQSPAKGERLEDAPLQDSAEAPIEAMPEPEPELDPLPEPEPVVETPEEEPVIETPKVESVFIPGSAIKEPEEPQKPKKKYHFVRDTLICVLILLLLLGGAYFFFRSQLTGWVDAILQGKPAQTEQVIAVPTDTTATAADALVVEETMAEAPVQQETPTPEDELLYEDLLTIERMHNASRLAWMAKRFYGDKRFWPYLYDANKDHITNPSDIAVGTPIRVPRLTAEQLDTTNVRSRAILERLRKEAEAACRR